GKRVLIVDDFLADGQAIQGMLDLVRQAGATAVGAAVAIEKGFQPGGQRLRAQGLEVLSLSIVRQIKDGKLLLSED
ncbi:MAG TPA: phosphoribosyltransferase family protein, partial [Clostridia bacterium]|nr:phosphoribosyltransferase family protein [Clostridia bacterium]